MKEWREEYKLTDDGTFAFIFSTKAEAIENAGSAVAEAWAVVRSLQMETMEAEGGGQAARYCPGPGVQALLPRQ